VERGGAGILAGCAAAVGAFGFAVLGGVVVALSNLGHF
jgi:hypothetical protein